MPSLTIQHFFVIYTALVLLGVAYLFWRRPRHGMRLKLKGGVGQKLKIFGQRHAGVDAARSLNVVFNYNGHSWDAYEVLGLPAGSPRERVDQAFRDACERIDMESRPFLEAAYRAIRDSA